MVEKTSWRDFNPSCDLYNPVLPSWATGVIRVGRENLEGGYGQVRFNL